jgi:HEAT repeat protein
VRQAAANGLSMCGDVALPAIQHILATSQHQGARTRAASAVRSIRTPASIPVLFRCLNDSNHLVHSYAREALDEMGLLDNVILLP